MGCAGRGFGYLFRTMVVAQSLREPRPLGRSDAALLESCWIPADSVDVDIGFVDLAALAVVPRSSRLPLGGFYIYTRSVINPRHRDVSVNLLLVQSLPSLSHHALGRGPRRPGLRR